MNRIEKALRKGTEFPDSYISRVSAMSGILEAIEGGTSLRNKIERTATGRATDIHRQVEALLFELKTVCWLAEVIGPEQIQYEPVGNEPEGPRVDFLLQTPSECWLVEAKTFHPDDLKTPVPHEYIADRNHVVMDEESFHRIKAVTTGLIHQAIDSERKARNYAEDCQVVLATLLGFYLGREKLRDFVALYRGTPRMDDPLRDMVRHYMEEHGLEFEGRVDQFWGLEFPQLSFAAKSSVAVGPLNDTEIQLQPSTS